MSKLKFRTYTCLWKWTKSWSQAQRKGYCTVLKQSYGQPTVSSHPHMLKEGEVTPGITKAEYKKRREMLLQLALCIYQGSKSVKDHLMIIPAAPRTFMSYDIMYPFRQNSEFLYLCGFLEADSVLILHNKQECQSKSHTSVLFVPKKNEDKELWEGACSGVDGAMAITGVDLALNIDDLEGYLYQYCMNHSEFVIWFDNSQIVSPKFHNKVFLEFLRQNKHESVQRTTPLIQELRAIKSPAEAELMKKSVDIACQAFVEVMKFSYPMINESYLYAKMDYECRVRDAQMLAYIPVVAGGNRANTIHYVSNNQIIEAGELVLMDAGCEYNGYTSDITRTWPVSGKFTPSQRKVYEAVLRVQEFCIRMCTPEFSLENIYIQMLKLIGQELQRLGIIPAQCEPEEFLKLVRAFCPHHVSHYLGMDVHDTAYISRRSKLRPGMVVTVEPGIYIQADNTTVPDEFRGIGIRIEDNILVTAGQPIVLSASLPKHPDNIETLLSYRY